MAVVGIEVYRKGNDEEPVNTWDADGPHAISQLIRIWKMMFWKVREVSRGCDENGHYFAEFLLVREDADMEVPFVQVQGEYAHLVFTMLPDYDDGYDLSQVED